MQTYDIETKQDKTDVLKTYADKLKELVENKKQEEK